jgi:hypothetical protein
MMKTFGKFCMMLTLAVSMIAFSSCSKDSDDDGGSSNSSLANTRWEGTSQNSYYIYTFQFSSSTFVLNRVSNGLQVPDELHIEGTYTLNGQTVSMTFTKASSNGEALDVATANAAYMRTANFSGNSLTYSGVTFYKK